MTLDSAGYRGWSQQPRSSWWACWSIARTSVWLVLRRKLFWLLLGLAALNFLFFFAMIYLKAQLNIENPGFRQFINRLLRSVSGTGETYRDFMFGQATVTMLLLAFAGAVLVGNDYRSGGMTFYLSRRIGRAHYVIGKLLAVAVLVSLTTTVPALILYLEYGLLTDSITYFRENYRILLGILGYGLILSLVLGLLLIALASWLQRTVPLVIAWAFIFVFVPALGILFRRVFDDRNWLLLMLWRDVRLLGTWCFGALAGDRDEALVWWALLVVTSVCVASAVAVIPRVRAMRVVR